MKRNLLILLLALSNLGMIVHFITCRNYSKPYQEAILVGKDAAPVNGMCFMENLAFNGEQETEFQDINLRFRQKVCPILRQLDQQKENMFHELQQGDSDTIKLQLFSRTIGELHRQLKEETTRFYLSVKAMCNPEQRQKLQHGFAPLFKNNCCPETSSCSSSGCLQKKIQFHKP